MARPADRQQALRRRHKHERQAVIFGSLIAALALAGLGSAAVYTGVLSVPFLQRDFSSPPPVGGDLPDPPCPVPGSLSVPYAEVPVNVLNASDRSGLAGQTAEALTARGFSVESTGNYPAAIGAPSQLAFGEAGLARAYTLAANLQSPQLVLDLRADPTVDLILGENFTGLLEPDLVTLGPQAPLPGVDGCVPIDVALSEARPAPVRAPAEGAPPADGGQGAEEPPAEPPAEG